jgi:hypothetical protein
VIPPAGASAAIIDPVDEQIDRDLAVLADLRAAIRSSSHVRAPARRWQALQGRLDRLHAQADRQPQCHPENPATLEN